MYVYYTGINKINKCVITCVFCLLYIYVSQGCWFNLYVLIINKCIACNINLTSWRSPCYARAFSINICINTIII